MNAIKRLRKKLGMSARQFGISCGLTGRNVARQVYRWENGSVKPSNASVILMEQLKQ